MTEITRVGADLAKSVIQVHAVDANGKVITNRPLARDKFMAWCAAQLPAGCMIATEASSNTHHWARKRNGKNSMHIWLGVMSVLLLMPKIASKCVRRNNSLALARLPPRL